MSIFKRILWPINGFNRSNPKPASQSDFFVNESDIFARDFIEWWHENDLPYCVECRVISSYIIDFSHFENKKPISSMALCKALHRLKVPKKWVYLRTSDPEYQRRIRYGEKRPRVLMIWMGSAPRQNT